MSLIVEDGTIVSGAESLCSVDYATTYHAARGNSAWTALETAQMEEALRKATDYGRQAYRQRWQGVRVSELQEQDFPRYGIIVDSWAIAPDIVPIDVQNAWAELALRSASAALNPDLKQMKTSVTVGPIKTDYDTNSPQQKRYLAVDQMLRPFFKAGCGCSTELVRR